MNKKDYIALAKLLAAFRSEAVRSIADSEDADWSLTDCIQRDLIVPLAHMLKADNPQFDYARFLAACGVKAEVA